MRRLAIGVLIGLGLVVPATPAPANGLIAYSDGRSVFTIPSAGGAPRRIAAGSRPAWSPDGRRLAWSGRGGIWVASASGAGAKLRIRQATNPSWSPHGTQLAFLRADGVWIAAVDGRRAYRFLPVVRLENTFIGGSPFLSAVAWSPDGRRIAYLGASSGALNADLALLVTPSRGRRTRTVLRYNDFAPGAGPGTLTGGTIAWMPDGRSLVSTGTDFSPPPTDPGVLSVQTSPDDAMTVSLAGVQPTGMLDAEPGFSCSWQNRGSGSSLPRLTDVTGGEGGIRTRDGV